MFNLFKSVYDGIPAKVEGLAVETSVNNQKSSYLKGIVEGPQIEDKDLRDSDTYKILDREFKKVQGYRGKPYDFLVSVAQKRVKANDALLQVVETTFGKKVLKDAITYERINVITYVSCCDWFYDFATAAIATMVSDIAYKNHDNPYKNPVDRLHKEFLNNRGNIATAVKILSLLNQDFNEAMKKASKLEGITFDPDDLQKQIDQFGASAVDPMGVGILPVSLNPFYWLGQVYNVWYGYRHEQIKEDISMLKMKLLRLERVKAGVPEDSDEIRDIDSQIEYHASRLAVLQEKLEDIENDA